MKNWLSLQKGGKTNWGQELQDFGSRMLHGLQTFGGSYIGDAIQGVSPKAANVVSKYTAGMIAPTPKSFLEKNRKDWLNRASSTADATSMILAGEMIGPAINKVVTKTAPALKKVSTTIKELSPNRSPKIEHGFDWEPPKPGEVWRDFRRGNENKVLAKNAGRDWINEWMNHPEFKARAKGLGYESTSSKTYTEPLNQIKKDIKKYLQTGKNNLFTKNPEIFLEYDFSGKLMKNKLPNPRFSKTIDSWGVSKANGRVLINPNQTLKNITSTTIHELGHSKFFNKFPDVSTHFKRLKAIPDEMITYITRAKEVGHTVSAKDLQNYRNGLKYLREPTESYARILETRWGSGIKPGEFVTTSKAANIFNQGIQGKTPVQDLWFKQLKSPLELKKMLNTFPMIGGVTYGINQVNNK